MNKFFYTVAFVLASLTMMAQGEANSLKGTPFKERIVFGGGFGLGFGSNADFFSLSPMVGYQITKRLMAGSGVSYRYTKYKLSAFSQSLNDYSVNPFARFTVYRNIFVQTEYEYMNYELPVSSTKTVRKGFDSALAGGGFIQPLGDRAAVFFMALYNFSYVTPQAGEITPYDSPWVIRIGINAGNFLF